ncbi:MAG TPA: IclR family transcriptional regulator [Terriglobales bacterium]|nr:IclR family transcriptional regulator [Terriglobales bacterium]
MSNAKPVAASVERAFSILEFLNTSKRGWNISEMSRKLNIPKSTTHVLVSTLDQLGYIQQSSRRFQLSTKMFGLGRNAITTNALPQMALPHLRWLVQETKLTAHIGILEKSQVVFVQKVDGPGIIKFDTYVGKCSELHCTGLGKALLAFQPQEMIDAILAKYVFGRFTKKTISSATAFQSELARVRQQGFAMDDEEEELGIRCIAAPIFASGAVLGAVSVTGTTTQIRSEDTDRIILACKSAAARVSAVAVDLA